MIGLFYIFFVVFIPYGIVKSGLPWVIASITAVGLLTFGKKKIKVKPSGLRELLFLYIFLIIHLLSINFYSMYNGIVYSWSDGFDFLIYLTYFLSTFLILSQSSEVPSERAFMLVVSIISIGLFYSSVVAWLGNTRALEFTMLYSTGDVYNAGYAQFRAFGIIGQPGKLGIFSIILTLYMLIIGIKTGKILYYSLAFVSFASAVSSFSRISLVTLILIVPIVTILMKNIKISFLIFFIYVFGILWVLNEHYEKILFLLRGIDIANLEFATLGHRLVLKDWALNFLSEDFIRILFGIGSPKEYLGSFTHPYARDLTLRHPDSSQTVILLRFGLFGSAVFYSVYTWYLMLHIKKNEYLTSTFILLYILLSFVDPTFHDLKLHVLFLLIIYYKVERFSKNGIG